MGFITNSLKRIKNLKEEKEQDNNTVVIVFEGDSIRITGAVEKWNAFLARFAVSVLESIAVLEPEEEEAENED